LVEHDADGISRADVSGNPTHKREDSIRRDMLPRA
jgi:hypothetical protein